MFKDKFYRTRGNDITVKIASLYQHVPKFIPDAQTQVLLNDSIRNSFTLSFDSWFTDRKPVDTGLEFQVNIGSAQNVNSPKYLILAHQSLVRIESPNKVNKIAFFVKVDFRNLFVEMDGIRYLEGSVNINYAETDYLDQYRLLIYLMNSMMLTKSCIFYNLS